MITRDYLEKVDINKAYRLLNLGATCMVSAEFNGDTGAMPATWVGALDYNPTKCTAVIAKDFKAVAITQGQTNAITAVEHALDYACDNSKEAVLASDAVLTAEDCIYSAVQARISLIIQPGGSIKDQSLIDVCDKYGIAMITTGIRNYRQ